MELITAGQLNWHVNYNVAVRVASNLLNTVYRGKYTQAIAACKAVAIAGDGRVRPADSDTPCHGVTLDACDTAEYGRVLLRGFLVGPTGLSRSLLGEDYYVIDNAGGIGLRDEVPWEGSYLAPRSSGRYVGRLVGYRGSEALFVDPRSQKGFFSMGCVVGMCTGATGVVLGGGDPFVAGLGPAVMPPCIEMTPRWQGIVMPRAGSIMGLSLSTPYIDMVGNPFYPELPATAFIMAATVNGTPTAAEVTAYANSVHESWQRMSESFKPGEHIFAAGDRVGMMFTETTAWAPYDPEGDPCYAGRHDLIGAVFFQFSDVVNENL